MTSHDDHLDAEIAREEASASARNWFLATEARIAENIRDILGSPADEELSKAATDFRDREKAESDAASAAVASMFSPKEKPKVKVATKSILRTKAKKPKLTGTTTNPVHSEWTPAFSEQQADPVGCEDPRLCWVETDGFAGRLSTPALLIEQGASACTVLLLARLKVNGRQWPAGVRKSVPAASVVRWPSVASTVLPIEFNPKEQPCQPEIPSPSPA